MARTLCIAIMCMMLGAVAWAEEPYMPKSGERVDWERVFNSQGLLDQEEDYSSVLGQSQSRDRVDWKRELAGPEKSSAVQEGAAPKDAPEIRYTLEEPGKAKNNVTGTEVHEEDLAQPEPVQAPAMTAKPGPSAPAAPQQAPKPKIKPDPAPAREPKITAAIEPQPLPEPLPEPEPKRLFSDSEVEHFLSIAFFDKDEQQAYASGGPAPRSKALTRWDADLVVQVKGAAEDNERVMLEEVANELDALVRDSSGLRVRMGNEGANVVVYFLPPRQGERMSGYVKKTYEGSAIVRADVVLYAGISNKADMMRHFMHALGFIGVSSQDGTVMRPNAALQGLADLPKKDAKALRMLYRSGLYPGTDIEEARRALNATYAY